MTDKISLRAEFLARRRAIGAPEAAMHAHALARGVLEALPGACACVGGYAATRGEAPVWEVLAALAELGVATALPVTPAPDCALRFRAWEPGDALAEGAYGIQEPAVCAPYVTPDVLLVPLLAFDRRFVRLGYGGGYYDRTLAELRKKGLKCAIGVGYGVQEAKRLPREAHDALLDAIVTEKEIIA